MWRLLKLIVVLAVLGFAGLVGYAYVGPFFGVDFSAPAKEIREPVTFDLE